MPLLSGVPQKVAVLQRPDGAVDVDPVVQQGEVSGVVVGEEGRCIIPV